MTKYLNNVVMLQQVHIQIKHISGIISSYTKPAYNLRYLTRTFLRLKIYFFKIAKTEIYRVEWMIYYSFR